MHQVLFSTPWVRRVVREILKTDEVDVEDLLNSLQSAIQMAKFTQGESKLWKKIDTI